MGSPGDADEATGVVSGAHNLPGWEGSFPLAEWLSKELGPPVRVGNDVQVAVEAEFHLGSGKPYKTVVGVFWGTGVGGGLMLDGEPWLGRGAAGEFGHLIVKPRRPPLQCRAQRLRRGLRGPLGDGAEGPSRGGQGREDGAVQLMKEHGRDRLSSGIWERALEHGDPLAKELMTRAEKALAAGIASAVNLIDPEAMILGGGMGTRFGDEYVPKIGDRMTEYLFEPDDPPAFEVAALGDLGGAIGAALLVNRA